MFGEESRSCELRRSCHLTNAATDKESAEIHAAAPHALMGPPCIGATALGNPTVHQRLVRGVGMSESISALSEPAANPVSDPSPVGLRFTSRLNHEPPPVTAQLGWHYRPRRYSIYRRSCRRNPSQAVWPFRVAFGGGGKKTTAKRPNCLTMGFAGTNDGQWDCPTCQDSACW